MNKLYVIRFLLEGGHLLEVIAPRDKAVQMVQAWASGQWALGGPDRLAGEDPYQDRAWAVDLKRVQGVLSYPAEQTQQQPPQVGRIGPGASGVAPDQTQRGTVRHTLSPR